MAYKIKGKKQKTFYQQDNIGRAKYAISYHDGMKKHNDGSDFYDIKIFHNKKDLEEFKEDLSKRGFKEK